MSEEITIADFTAAFEKLKHNREKVPLDQLQTRYGKSYRQLVQEVEKYARWFTEQYLLSLEFPENPKDEVGNQMLRKNIDKIIEEEQQPGGLYDQQKAALIDHLDLDEFYELVYQLYNKIFLEAYTTYWNQHCREVKNPATGTVWIYNDIIRKYWLPPSEKYPEGCWIDSNRQVHFVGWPHISRRNNDEYRKPDRTI